MKLKKKENEICVNVPLTGCKNVALKCLAEHSSK